MSPEPQQVLASLQYELGDMDGALKLLKQSMSKWWPQVHRSVDMEAADEDQVRIAAPDSNSLLQAVGDQCEAQNSAASHDVHANQHANEELTTAHETTAHDCSNTPMPSYEFRVECCKLLLELDDSTATVLEVRSLYHVCLCMW